MAAGFPMTLSQLLPLLDVIGAANKQLGKAAGFMRKCVLCWLVVVVVCCCVFLEFAV